MVNSTLPHWTFLCALTASQAVSAESACQKLCSERPNECLEVGEPADAQDEANVPEGLKRLYDQLFDPSVETITDTDLLSAFGLHEDPCARSDTTISTLPSEDEKSSVHNIFNTGLNCRVATSVILPGGSRISAGFYVPDILDLTLSYIGDYAYIEPNLSNTIPAVFFSKNSLQADFGGPVTAVTFGETQSFVETANGCIWIRYD